MILLSKRIYQKGKDTFYSRLPYFNVEHFILKQKTNISAKMAWEISKRKELCLKSYKLMWRNNMGKQKRGGF